MWLPADERERTAEYGGQRVGPEFSPATSFFELEYLCGDSIPLLLVFSALWGSVLGGETGVLSRDCCVFNCSFGIVVTLDRFRFGRT